MNSTKYLQTDSRWSNLGYPVSPCTIGNSGCGEVSIVNCIIEMTKYANYTPKTIQPYAKQYAAANCDGTYWSGIPAMMKYYGLEEVKEHDTMDKLFAELAKGDRVAIYLMGSRKGGSKGVSWTTSGHFVCSVDYKKKDGKNYVYVKDSYSNSSLRNGWITYEENMKGDVLKVWSGKLSGKLVDGTVITDVKSTDKLNLDNSKLTVDGIGGKATVRAMQKYFGTTQDGVISGQLTKYKTLYPSLQSVEYGKGGSACIKKLQTWLGLSGPDGYIGPNTTKAWQKKLVSLGYLAKNETIDGIFGVKSMKAWQECLNNSCKKKESKTSTNNASTSKNTTVVSSTKKYKVIDVSEWQGDIDWKKVKADGVVAAIIRYGDGDYLDKKFKTNMKNAIANGLHVGAYIFSRAKTKKEAEQEATRLYNACKSYETDMPLYIDLEASGLEKVANTVAQAFIKKMNALGGYPGVYANLNWWNNYLKTTAKLSFAMWLAQYNDKMTYTPASYVGMWQYSSSGKVNGISGKVDMDWLYIEYWNKIEPSNTTKTRVVEIGQATSNENGKTIGGKAGDQTGKEVAISKWSYSSKSAAFNHWEQVFRAKDSDIAKKIAQAMIDACNNKHIGYDLGVNDRGTLYDEAKKKKWDIAAITKDVETCCVDLVSVCLNAAGINTPKAWASKNVYKDLMATGEFECFTSKDYVASSAKLKVGDILCSPNAPHTAMVVSVKEG